MKICRQLPLLALALVAVLGLVSNARADAFDDANRAFAAGRYAQSVQGYQAVLKHDGSSPAVLFNLGNAELRAGHPGDSILDYERARWLAPRDPDIAANLRFARQRAGLAVADESWTTQAADLLSANAWAWLGSAALVAFSAGLLAAQLRGRQAGWWWLANTASAVILLGAVAATAVRAGELDRAILPAKSTAALISPFSGAKTAFEFPAGETVRMERTHADYTFVRDAAGHAGWVSDAQVGRIVPGSPRI